MKSFISLLLVLTACLGCKSSDNTNFAPLYQSIKSNESVHKRGLGPIYEDTQTPGHTRFAIRPLYSNEYLAEGDKEAHDYLWPLAYSRRLKEATSARYLLYCKSNHDIHDPKSGERDWLFPLWFQGQSYQGNKYKALFPIHGKIHDFLSYDTVGFTLFPFYVTFDKMDTHSYSYLWPFHSNSKKADGSAHAFRILPFYANSVKHESHKSRSIIWPFYHDGYSLNQKKPAEWYFFFPFYGRYSSPDAEKTTFLWPFFSSYKSKNKNTLNAPWPFHTKGKSEERSGPVSKLYFWPFYLENKTPETKRQIWLWPFICQFEQTRPKDSQKLNWFLPFYWNYRYYKEAKLKDQHIRFWPFYSYSKRNGHTLHKILDIWPQRDHPTIERNFSPLWHLYTSYHDEQKSRHDFLWGLYQQEKYLKIERSRSSLFPFYEFDSVAPEKKSDWNIFKGLIGRETRKNGNKAWRLLWIFSWANSQP